MLFDLIKSAVLGIIQGITEWLPVSSTGHLILFEQFLRMDVSDEFMEMFRVVIQLGSIMAVVVLYFNRLNPFSPKKGADGRKRTWVLWLKVLIASVPAGILGVLFDDWFDEHFYNPLTVACALIIYGAAFIVIERVHAKRNAIEKSDGAENISFRQAAGIGCFQALSIIPGTSRSGSTILGARILGVTRTDAAEFSFFMAIPVMLGASLLKIVKFGFDFTRGEAAILAIGMITAFAVSLCVIKLLVGFVRKHSFEVFGWYRIVLGAAVLICLAAGVF